MLPKTGSHFRDPNINSLYSYQTLHQQQPCPETFSPPDQNYYKPIYMNTTSHHTLFNVSSASTTTSEFPNNFSNILPQAVLHGSMEQQHLPELLKHENERFEVNIDDSYWSLLHEEYGFLVNNDDQIPSDAWKSNLNLVWDSSPCLSEMSTSYKCYTWWWSADWSNIWVMHGTGKSYIC